jgi:hypothetical protein
MVLGTSLSMLILYMYDPERVQLLYFHLSPQHRNPWTWILSLALEVPQVLMTMAGAYFAAFQLLFFHSCARDFEGISKDLS